MFDANNPTSPLFMGLLLAVLIDIMFAWSAFAKGRLPNMHTSLRGARLGGVFALLSLAFVFVSYYFFSEATELFGTFAFVIAFALFVGGIMLAERVPD